MNLFKYLLAFATLFGTASAGSSIADVEEIIHKSFKGVSLSSVKRGLRGVSKEHTDIANAEELGARLRLALDELKSIQIEEADVDTKELKKRYDETMKQLAKGNDALKDDKTRNLQLKELGKLVKEELGGDGKEAYSHSDDDTTTNLLLLLLVALTGNEDLLETIFLFLILEQLLGKDLAVKIYGKDPTAE
eukprot:CAMPEP_0178967090 /NCGR_PEP_ID=MMETSP0789-20121207/17350_1 /TAXON_ID=3005 /ORGANISM="Rhizosolenia setigera, Strain CCMP 1694" /LENGTH=190 /DNA_ID=CAMNT_0020652559 /DNA_START=160 /DNA_END=732 /DNA_ORIENTATION=+